MTWSLGTERKGVHCGSSRLVSGLHSPSAQARPGTILFLPGRSYYCASLLLVLHLHSYLPRRLVILTVVAMSSSKRKLPLSATVGLTTSEQAGQPGGAPSSSSLKRSKVSFATDTGPLNDDGSLDTGDDADLLGADLDLEEQDRKRNQQGRKGRVVTEGYDSEDSDEEEEEEEQVDAAAQAVDGGEEDDDMFEVKDSNGQTGSKGATAPPAKDSSGKGKGTERYLSLGEIEGQEFQTGATGALSDESDDEDRDPDLELEDEDEDEDEEGEGEDIEDDPVAAGERTPPLSPGGTTVLPRDPKTIRRQKGLKGKAARKQKVGADRSARSGSSSGMPAGQPGEGSTQAQMDFDDAAMGFKLEGFNMKSEMNSGRFDEEGNYIPNAKDPLAKYDKWLDGNYSKKGIRAAREAAEKRETEARRREREEEMIAGAGGMEGVMMRLLEYMQKGESVLETLQRLGKEAKKVKDEAKKAGRQQRRSTTQRRNGAAAAGGDESIALSEGQPVASSSSSTSQQTQTGHGQVQQGTQTQTETPAVIAAIETFTSLTSTLMGQFNQVNIYDEEYEGLLRSVRKSGLVAEDWQPIPREAASSAEGTEEDGAGTSAGSGSPALPGALYEYRWSPSYLQATTTDTGTTSVEASVETFGPYDLPTLRSWREAGYFGDAGPEGKGAERILLRRAAPPEGVRGAEGVAGEWKSWGELLGGT